MRGGGESREKGGGSGGEERRERGEGVRRGEERREKGEVWFKKILFRDGEGGKRRWR